ncbi:acetyl-CoA acetyltransferase, partial [Candidatus Sumerlaeota bacterium]|nr:acetyl-CoA acetyltransferase [Candidatus Sumerlaeota bacterium]
ESFSAVAAKNPYAWFPAARSAQEAVTIGPNNRMISFPYPKYLNAVMEVDQAAAVIMTSTDKARALGIPESKWVYIHGGQDAHDLWFVSEREDLAESIAIRRTVADSLDQAGITLDQINFFDFYSCFPCMPRLSRYVLGMSHDDPRPMTITGGLPYFGGAGNNYVMHSIAEAMNRCRADRNLFGMVTSNGFYSTKHGVGIYSGQPPKRAWSRTPPEEFQKSLNLPPPMEIDEEPTGKFTVDSYTVWHDRNGDPEVGILIGRTEAGKRAWAQTAKENKDLMRAMMNEEWCGKVGKFTVKNGKANLADF